VPKALTLSSLAAVFAVGLVLAVTLPVGGGAADATTTDTTTTDTTATDTTTTETTTTPETTTETTTTTTTLPGRTVTVETTTTNFVTLPTPTTTTEETSTSGNGTEAWVWVLLGILAAGLIALIVLFATRGHGGGGGAALSPEDRLRRLDGAVASWAAQGWAVETQTADSAVLRRGAEAMLVSVDPGGHVATRPLAEPPAPPQQESGSDWPGAPGDS
jgi:hypothetical protein